MCLLARRGNGRSVGRDELDDCCPSRPGSSWRSIHAGGGTAMATARAERRLAAILAADVVGYSRLMERDEDRTLARLKAHRKEFIEPLIAEYQGRIVKLMGDGALVEFASAV